MRAPIVPRSGRPPRFFVRQRALRRTGNTTFPRETARALELFGSASAARLLRTVESQGLRRRRPERLVVLQYGSGVAQPATAKAIRAGLPFSVAAAIRAAQSCPSTHTSCRPCEPDYRDEQRVEANRLSRGEAGLDPQRDIGAGGRPRHGAGGVDRWRWPGYHSASRPPGRHFVRSSLAGQVHPAGEGRGRVEGVATGRANW